MASNIPDAMVQALQEVEQAREILADYRGISTDNVNLVEDLNHMFLTVKIQSDELGMIDYNGYKAKIATLEADLKEANEKAKWWENEARQGGKMMLFEQAEVDRLRGELATVAKERDEAIEELRGLYEGAEIDQGGKLYVLVLYSPDGCQPTNRLVTAHDERQRALTDVMANGG